MGINPTPTNHRSFTYDGKSTREFGVYITGKGVFNAPERAVEMISIPGRDGEYALDQGHFNNIEVTYRAGIVADSTTDFAEAISNFRNWLASREGYCRLTDEYNTEEYRMAVFKNAIALEHEGLLTGEFDVTFDCKPQRYLAIGEELTEIGAWGNTETAEGDIVTIEASSDTAVKALTADLDPIQDLHGYDAPWVGGAGKNKLEIVVTAYSGSGVTISQNGNDVHIVASGASSYPFTRVGTVPASFPSGTYSLAYSKTISGIDFRLVDRTVTPAVVIPRSPNGNVVIPDNHNELRCEIAITGASLANGTYDVSVGLMPQDTAYAPYSNICPISGHDDVTVTVADDVDNPTVSEDYTTTLPSTTYGGTLDVVSGTLKPAPYYASYNGEALEGEWVSDRDKYVAGTTPTTGAQVVNIGKVGTATQLTGQSIELLEGENNIFADSGQVTVEYGHNPTLLTNPTWFPSKPLLAVEGYGNIGFNKHEINIENVTLGEITLEESLQGDGYVSFYIDTSKVNIGDPVTLNINQFGFELLAQTNGGYLESNSLTVNDSNNNFHTTYTIPTPYAWNPYIDFVTTVSSPINLTVGTNATITNTVSGVWTLNTNNTITYSFETVVLYYGTTNHKVVIRRRNFSATISGNDIKQAASVSGPLIKLNSATANSTVSALGNPTYIDCDIGECYMIKDDSPISLNQYIDLGSDLPTLPSGDTEVTYDNTITKVEVKPNWWKV